MFDVSRSGGSVHPVHVSDHCHHSTNVTAPTAVVMVLSSSMLVVEHVVVVVVLINW